MSKIVIIGGGFGGLMAAKMLKGSKDEITIVDRTNYHLFQPLLYQVATAALSPGDIALPIRVVFRKYKNVRVILDEVISINRSEKKVIMKDGELNYDYLVIATGSRHSYFGNEQWEKNAPGLKTLRDALLVRERILFSLEKAENETDPDRRKKYLTYVIVGGGPTGVEMAGAIAEIAKKCLMKDFRNFNALDTKIYLIEAGPHVLKNYPEVLSVKAENDLEKMGVDLKLNTRVINVDADGVETDDGDIKSSNIIWAAGNAVSPMLKSLNTNFDHLGRVEVLKDLSIEGDQRIFIVGDAALYLDKKGKQLPMLAPVAIQEGRYVGKIIKKKIPPEHRKAFHYKDKGILATIGMKRAVADIHGLKLSGYVAWAAWCFIHIFFLIGFRNRFKVMAEWAWYYLTFRNGIRLIVGKPDKVKESKDEILAVTQ